MYLEIVDGSLNLTYVLKTHLFIILIKAVSESLESSHIQKSFFEHMKN